MTPKNRTLEVKGEFIVDKNLDVIRIVSPFGPGWIELYNSIVWNDGDTWTLDGFSVLDILDTMGAELYDEDLDEEEKLEAARAQFLLFLPERWTPPATTPPTQRAPRVAPSPHQPRAVDR